MSWLDLHMHSDYSDDGEHSPSALVSICMETGVRVAALSDHNTTRGVPEALEAAQKAGITMIPSVEIDCTCNDVDIHMLGYWIDPLYAGFQKIEKDILDQEHIVAKSRIRLVKALGVHVDEEKTMSLAKNGVVTGEMIAETVLADPQNDGIPLLRPYRPGGARSDNPLVNFYWDFCSQGKPAFVPVRFLSAREAADKIRAAGGIPVLAHPGNNIGGDEALLNAIIDCGVVGMEVFSSYHNAAQTAFYKKQALDKGLAMSCGSDFHGKIKPAIRMGGVDCEGAESELLAALMEKAGRTNP